MKLKKVDSMTYVNAGNVLHVREAPYDQVVITLVGGFTVTMERMTIEQVVEALEADEDA
jgi:hypothetical protein